MDTELVVVVGMIGLCSEGTIGHHCARGHKGLRSCQSLYVLLYFICISFVFHSILCYFSAALVMVVGADHRTHMCACSFQVVSGALPLLLLLWCRRLFFFSSW